MTAATGSRTSPRRRANSAAPRDTPAAHSGRDRDDAARPGSDEWLTVDEVCKELKIGRRTFERWRMLGKAPRAIALAGNGPLRIRHRWLEEWMETGRDNRLPKLQRTFLAGRETGRRDRPLPGPLDG